MNQFLQYIFEQPKTLREVLDYSLTQEFPRLQKAATLIQQAERVYRYVDRP